MDPEKKSNGALIGAIVIIVILLAGGIYLWQSNAKSALENKELQNENVSPSDQEDLESLDQELNTTELDIEANVVDSVE
ncbi:MAG: hypothetical protein WCT29_03115 [Candidatus Paceibacterota bacterium]|jgi:type VI protein secretion system component VasK